ncbi:beta-glucosidase [Paenibacillus cellulosilyticus]|uniref:Beta-glucosidase n=1 Tax=Paenibacillus cellulosilyticus TaxID=375489 RepID=A0A2V2YRV1_9BACL|nr:glycoside hydrolase family 3 C-terminal domain-containing protein [Paenibacillus cellulosilyticus]PWW00773.1 beta-glucosidase [Paenibacillus cellulosilyticus]QKS45628.1 glycoside hydrolase family 3 C-terminal domain-containing protein [Paenibacillus cellulosilyticus]
MSRDLQQLISEMTLEEKASLCSGLDFWNTKPIERLGIPSIMVTDGPHGLRKQKGSGDHLGLFDSVPATCFPSAAGLASSWNRDLIREVGIALGEECQAENVGVLLGPGVNIKRSPLCGRNFEYFSEDPYLSSEMAANHIIGVQSQGVGTSLKHFAANNQEHRRMSVDAIVDERTLREIYLASFEGAVKKGEPWTVMCSYNKVNGEFASQNEQLLTKILKEEWGHAGFVVSDWGAVVDRVPGLAAGLELEMPATGGVNDRKIVEAVQSGRLSIDVLDEAVRRLLTVIFQAADQHKEGSQYDQAAHHQLARRAAAESMVLLKNEEAVLPLPKQGSLAVIGEFCYRPRYQGGGSSHIVPTQLDNLYEEIVRSAGAAASVVYAQGYKLDSDESDDAMIAEAAAAAASADHAVLFIGLPDRYESEGYDRSHLQIPANQQQLVAEIAKVQLNLIVVLCNGAPIEMPWLPHAKAVLEGYLGGQALGGAFADLLFGDVNPSGKLAETFPKKLSHNPSHLNFPGHNDRVEYHEGGFVGYRYYDMKEIEPLFPFGYGLSYTQFEYSNLSVSRKSLKDTDTVEVRLTVHNVGTVAGKEIVQLYVHDKESTVVRPKQELKGFVKVDLAPGEGSTVQMTLDKRAFAYYNTTLGDWHVESGEFELRIGKSSQDIMLTETITVESTVPVSSPFTRHSTLGDLLKDPVGAQVVGQMMQQFQAQSTTASLAEEAPDMMMAMMQFMPIRAMVTFSQGAFTEQMLDGLLTQLNGAAVES